MRVLPTALLTLALALPLLAAPSLAGVRSPVAVGCFPNESPCPSRCIFDLHGGNPAAPCQFRFRPDGGLDQLTLSVTLRDAFDLPVSGCSTHVTVQEGPGTLALCSCCGLERGAITGPDGDMEFVFESIGGRGTFVLTVTSHCAGNIGLFSEEIAFTSSDMNGSCEPVGSTTILDIGLMAGCFHSGSYCLPADFDCSGDMNIQDIGLFASGLTRGCSEAACP